MRAEQKHKMCGAGSKRCYRQNDQELHGVMEYFLRRGLEIVNLRSHQVS